MSTIDDFRSATFAAQSYDATVAEAWASSPLGDPAIEDGSMPHPAEFDDFPLTTVTAEPTVVLAAEPAAEPRPSRWTNLLVGAAVVAALGTVSWLGVVLVNGTGSKATPAVVAPNSTVGSVLPQTPVAPAPPVATPPDSGQGPAGPVGRGDAPAWTGPAPTPAPVGAAPADPGIPPAAPPPAPPVIVNYPPPVVPAPIYVPLPPHHEGGKHGDDDQQGGGQNGGGTSGGGKNGGGQSGGSGQQGPKGPKVGQPAPVGGGHPGQVACLPCQKPHPSGKK